MPKNTPAIGAEVSNHKVNVGKIRDFLIERKYTVALALISAITFVFLSKNHTLLPMWVEGIGEYQHVLLIMLGFIKANPACWINFHDINIPLALNAYSGPAFFYFHLPTAYLWFNGYTSDPYIYRYAGMVIFFADVWLLFYTLRTYYKVPIAFYAATAFLTAGFLVCLSEGGSYFLMLFFVFIAVFFFSRYIKTGSVGYLLAASLTYGMTLTTRVEFFIWSFIPFVIYLIIARPRIVLDRWRQTPRKVLAALGVLITFCIGASPLIIYNLMCPAGGLLSFVNNKVLPDSFGPATMPLTEKLQVRLEQFWYGNLLGTSGPDTGPENYVFAGLWMICTVVLIVRWITQRKASLFLIIIVTAIPLSLFIQAQLRFGHLAAIQPAVLMVIVSGLAYLSSFRKLEKLAHLAFVLLILANTYISITIWRTWKNQPDTVQTMSNQSDPIVLADYLKQHHSNDRVLYTNIGMAQYMSYMTAGTFNGEEIMAWGNDEGFANNVRIALLDSNKQRVFVAVAKERDGAPGTLRRTNQLYSLLEQYKVPYKVVPLSNERNRFLYDMVSVESGVTLKQEALTVGALRLSDVVDVRVVPQGAGSSLVIGSLYGAGFKLGDVILINGTATFQTSFGNPGWITFTFPVDSIEGNTFTLEVLNPQTLERTRAQSVTIAR